MVKKEGPDGESSPVYAGQGRLPASIKPLKKTIIFVRVGGDLCRVRMKTFLRAVAGETTTMDDESELSATAGVVAFVRAFHGNTDFPLTVANVGRQVHFRAQYEVQKCSV